MVSKEHLVDWLMYVHPRVDIPVYLTNLKRRKLEELMVLYISRYTSRLVLHIYIAQAHP